MVGGSASRSGATGHGENLADVDAPVPPQHRCWHARESVSRHCDSTRVQRLDLVDQVLDAQGLVGGLDPDILEAFGGSARASACRENRNRCCIGCSIGQRDRIRYRRKCPVSGVLIMSVPPGLSNPRHRLRKRLGSGTCSIRSNALTTSNRPIVGHGLQHSFEDARPDRRHSAAAIAPGVEFHAVHVEAARRGDLHEVPAGAADVEQTARLDPAPSRRAGPRNAGSSSAWPRRSRGTRRTRMHRPPTRPSSSGSEAGAGRSARSRRQM